MNISTNDSDTNNSNTDGSEKSSAIARTAKQFRNSFKTLQLATVNEVGQPHASYTPYVLLDDMTLGIFVSRLSQHTRNLLSQPTASVLFVEAEKQCSNVFSRQRLNHNCSVNHHTHGTESFTQIITTMEERFGAIIKQLKQLPDFETFTLHINTAEYVVGFGRAYRFSAGKLTDAKLIKG